MGKKEFAKERGGEEHSGRVSERAEAKVVRGYRKAGCGVRWSEASPSCMFSTSHHNTYNTWCLGIL